MSTRLWISLFAATWLIRPSRSGMCIVFSANESFEINQESAVNDSETIIKHCTSWCDSLARWADGMNVACPLHAVFVPAIGFLGPVH